MLVTVTVLFKVLLISTVFSTEVPTAEGGDEATTPEAITSAEGATTETGDDVTSDPESASDAPPNEPVSEAVVVLQESKGVHGNISFVQEKRDSPVVIIGTITGLTPGRHGFHIHQKGDLRQGCASAAGHFNPDMQSHGAPAAKNRHIGDLGNIEADSNGVAQIMTDDSLISLSGVNSIIGRAVVVHEKEDDLGLGGSPDSLKTGNAGGRLACGVIGIV